MCAFRRSTATDGWGAISNVAGVMVGSGFRRAASSVVEHLTFNQGVPGSIPGRPTNLRSRAFVSELRLASQALTHADDGASYGWRA